MPRDKTPKTAERPRIERSFRLALDELRKAVLQRDTKRGDAVQRRLLNLFSTAVAEGLVAGDPEDLVAETARHFVDLRNKGALSQRQRGATPSGRANARARARLLAAMRIAALDAYNAAKARGEAPVFVTAPAAAKLGRVVLEPGDTEQAFKARAKRRRKTHPKAAAYHDRKLGEFWGPLLRASEPPPGVASGTKAPLKRG